MNIQCSLRFCFSPKTDSNVGVPRKVTTGNFGYLISSVF